MTEITIKFKDRNRSDLKLKVHQDNCVEYYPNGLVRIPVVAKEGVTEWKFFLVDIIEEMIIREIKEDLK